MIWGILMAMFITVQPITISTPHLLCNQGKCPKIACFVGWQYKGYDMNGRLYTTCRSYTQAGQELKNQNDKLFNKVKGCSDRH
jgi:predicted NAD-dependent protein-ADP-ribosyltransferase YbiA (DUF1768 family)